MSDSDDRGTRPPRPGAGKSGRPSSISQALGGDLDFEPDALLDLLTESDPPPKEPGGSSQPPGGAVPAPSAPANEQNERETLRPSYPDDEVTLVGPREMFEAPTQHPVAPAPPSLRTLPSGPDSTMKTPLVQRPPEHLPRTGGAAARQEPPVLRPPPGVPRPGASGMPLSTPVRPPPVSSLPTRAPGAPSRPIADSVSDLDIEAISFDAPEATVRPEPPSTPPEPPSAPPEPPTTPPEPRDTTSSAPPDSTRTSLSPEEIAALDELESLAPAEPSRPPPRVAAAPPPVPSIASVPPPRVNDGPTLPRPGQPDEWNVRAEWMESEARLLGDPQARSRALVVASEIWAIAGNLERARRAAQDASSAGRAVMAGRQLRWLAGAGGDWKTVASALELELRGSSTPEARAHAAYLDAEVQRLCLADDAAATKAIDLVLAADPNDPRAHLAKLVQALGTTAAAPALELPDAPELEELRNAIGDVARLRAGSGAAGGQGPLAAFAIARRAIARGDRAAAATALGEVGMVEGLAGAASWLSAALLCHDAGTRAEAAARLRALSDGPDAAPARRALAARALELGDPALLGAALEFSAEAFSAADRLVLRALTDRNPADIDMMAEDVADEDPGSQRRVRPTHGGSGDRCLSRRSRARQSARAVPGRGQRARCARAGRTRARGRGPRGGLAPARDRAGRGRGARRRNRGGARQLGQGRGGRAERARPCRRSCPRARAQRRRRRGARRVRRSLARRRQLRGRAARAHRRNDARRRE